ncbi:hypothetical protein [Nitrosopumilus sp. b2]|uniref:hypothetical protein n=1 Tax=Nitrosopumilus sp. b2 TaxID=2109908 RepID=UPI0015F5B90A|nr:hypothetical protein [Nitrosopumilus sp. b2]KAF6244335.1 hypothetical protein C6989_08620 [Nitrosopumilus sp. b2]
MVKKSLNTPKRKIITPSKKISKTVTPPESVFLKLPETVIETRVHTLDYHTKYGHVGIEDFPVSTKSVKTDTDLIKVLTTQGRLVKKIKSKSTFDYTGFVLSTHLNSNTGELFEVMHSVKDEKIIRYVDQSDNDGEVVLACGNTMRLWLQYYG